MLQRIKNHITETVAEGERKDTPLQRGVIIGMSFIVTLVFWNLPVLWQ
jgi:hypothetical protein